MKEIESKIPVQQILFGTSSRTHVVCLFIHKRILEDLALSDTYEAIFVADKDGNNKHFPFWVDVFFFFFVYL